MGISDWSADVCSSELAQSASRSKPNGFFGITRTINDRMRFLHNARPYGNRAEIVILNLPGKGLILLPGLQDKVDPLLRHATCLFRGRIIGMMLIGRPTQEEHRSEARRVGTGGVSTFRSRCSPYH